MCGRYVLDFDHGIYVAGVEIDEDIKNFNVAPTHNVPILIDHWVGEHAGQPAYDRRLHAARWGLIPSWADEAAIGVRAFNARSETVFAKPMFRKATVAGHCAIPVTGYYEWKTETLASGKQKKTPHFVHSQDGKPIYFAGLYEWWQVPASEAANPKSAFAGQEGNWVLSTSIMTMDAPDELDVADLAIDGFDEKTPLALSQLHDRLPVPLTFNPEDPENDTVSLWLRSGDVAGAPSKTSHARQNSEAALETIKTQAYAVTSDWDLYPVSTVVGNVRNNGPQLIEPEEDLLTGLS